MGEGLFTLDLGGRVTYINRTAETLLGWPIGELRGRPIGAVIHPSRPDGSARPRRNASSLARSGVTRTHPGGR